MNLNTHVDLGTVMTLLDIMDLTLEGVPCACCQQCMELKLWNLRMDNLMELVWMRL